MNTRPETPQEPQGRVLADEEITKSVIGGFYAVYNALGYGFVESVYSAALEHELVKRGHGVGREVSIPIWYDGVIVARQRLDMLIDDRVVVENKVTDHLAPEWERKTYNYLCAARREVALLFYFTFKPRVRRIYHRLPQRWNPADPDSS